MSSANRMWLKGGIPCTPWLMRFDVPMSFRYRESALMKREKRSGERTLPCATPVLNVIFALPMSE